jgi:hypothetical protein
MVERLRLTLLVSLALLALMLLWRRFKQRVMARDLPAPAHAELLSLQVAYHPPRLRAEVLLPEPQEVLPAMLDAHHRPVHRWSPQRLEGGAQVLELSLEGRPDGEHFFELATHSQRTVRRFILRSA